MREDRITLHSFRWPYAVARAAVYLAILSLFALIDPAASRSSDAVRSRTAGTFELRQRDIVIVLSEHGTFIAGRYYYQEKSMADGLAWLRSHNPTSRLVLRARRSESFGRVRILVAALQQAGYRRLTIETVSARPLLVRRMASLTALNFDNSEVIQPPDDGMDMRWSGIWY